MPNQTPVTRHSITIFPAQEAVLDQVAGERPELGSISAAIRYIITDWTRLRGTAVPDSQPDAENAA